MERLSELTDSIRAQPRGADFARFAWLLMHTKGDVRKTEAIAAERFAQHSPAVTRTTKAAVATIGTMSDGFVDNASWRGISGEILSMVATQTVLGRLKGTRRIPFNRPALTELTPATAQWVGQGRAKPLSTFALNSTTLELAKIVAMVVFSNELADEFSPAALQSIIDNTVASLAKFADEAFLDPSLAAIAGERPASITFAITPTASSGSSASAISADLRDALARMVNAGSDLSGVSIVLHPATAVFLSSLSLADGGLAFPSMGVGTSAPALIWGIPVLVSLAVEVSGSPSQRSIVLIDAKKILVADDGRVRIDSSREASMQMVTNPSDGATQAISLWQLNLQCLKIERYISWARAHDSAVAIISNVTY
ncbi:MAG: phage major capsid protein [Casimicrobiaceae bacterium]